MYVHAYQHTYIYTATCKIIRTDFNGINGLLYQITTGKPLKRVRIILQVAVYIYVCLCFETYP